MRILITGTNAMNPSYHIPSDMNNEVHTSPETPTKPVFPLKKELFKCKFCGFK